MNNNTWPFLMIGAALTTLAIGLTVYTTMWNSLPAAMWAAISGQAGCTIIALVCLDHQLHRHRQVMKQAIVDERVRLEEIAESAADAAVARVRELRSR